MKSSGKGASSFGQSKNLKDKMKKKPQNIKIPPNKKPGAENGRRKKIKKNIKVAEMGKKNM